MVEKVGRCDLWVLWTKLPYKIFRITQILLSNFPLETPRLPPRAFLLQISSTPYLPSTQQQFVEIEVGQSIIIDYPDCPRTPFSLFSSFSFCVSWFCCSCGSGYMGRLRTLAFCMDSISKQIDLFTLFFFFVILENYRFFFVLECGSLHQKYKSNIC